MGLVQQRIELWPTINRSARLAWLASHSDSPADHETKNVVFYAAYSGIERTIVKRPH